MSIELPQSTPSSLDLRQRLVGRRKAGYCGHVPQYSQFTVTSLNSTQAPRPATAQTGDAIGADREGFVARVRSATRIPSRTLPLWLTREGPPVPPTRGAHYLPIIGYCGHRHGEQFHTGCIYNGERKSDVAADAMRTLAQHHYPSGVKPARLPKYPVFRGPTRKTPTGYEVFLTN